MLSLYLSLSISLSIALSLSLYLSLSISLYFCLSLYLSISLSVSLSICLCLSLYLSLHFLCFLSSQQRKMLPPHYVPGEDPVSVIRRVLGMVQTPATVAVSASAATAATATAAKPSGHPTPDTHTRLQHPNDHSSPWRPQSPSHETQATTSATASTHPTATATDTKPTGDIVGGAALRVTENHFVRQDVKKSRDGDTPHQPKSNALWVGRCHYFSPLFSVFFGIYFGSLFAHSLIFWLHACR